MKIKLNPSEDILLMYPELVTLEKFIQSIIEKYEEDNISKIIWALILDFHPKSIYNNLPLLKRRETIELEYLDFKLDWDHFKEHSETLKNFCLSKAEQYLYAWEAKLDERQELIASIPYSLNTYEDLDKMMSLTEKMWKQYQNCLKDVAEEDSKLEGTAVESISEQELI
jgi:hypothetical protein